MSFTPLLKKLAERYHVYGIVMRSSGITSKVAADGEIDWSAQWCDDIVQFAYALDIDKFIYLGKCHGSMPGWKILQEHPEMLKAYIPISMIPGSHLLSSPNLMKMIGLRNEENGLLKFIQAIVRKPESVAIKINEMKTLGPEGLMTSKHMGSFTEFENYDKVLEYMSHINTPMLMIYGTEDPGYKDWTEQIFKLAAVVPDMKLVTYQGERHLFEIDVPDKIANEVIFYLPNL